MAESRLAMQVKRPPTIFERDGKPLPVVDAEEEERHRFEVVTRESNLERILRVLGERFVASAYVPSVPADGRFQRTVDHAVEDAIDSVKTGVEQLHLDRGMSVAASAEGGGSDDHDAEEAADGADTDADEEQKRSALDSAQAAIDHFVASATEACRDHCKPFTDAERAFLKKLVRDGRMAVMDLTRRLDHSKRRLKEFKDKAALHDVTSGVFSTPDDGSRRESLGDVIAQPAATRRDRSGCTFISDRRRAG
jgi:hypothetical protein